MVQQLNAGYVLGGIKNYLAKFSNGINWDSVLQSLSNFEIESEPANFPNSDPIFSVADNLISRGLPTLPSLFIEQTFSKIFKRTEEKVSTLTQEISFELSGNEKDLMESIRRAFFVIDPRLTSKDRYYFSLDTWEKHPGSQCEEIFLYELLPQVVGEYAVQVLELQREIINILRYSEIAEKSFRKSLGNNAKDFYDQKVDFSFQSAKIRDEKNGFVIEVDGPQHDTNLQHGLDKLRDKAISDIGWNETLRIRVSELTELNSQKINELKKLFSHRHLKILKYNYDNKLYETNAGMEALQLTLSPIAIARIQKVLIQCMLSGQLTLDQKEWSIAVIERDIPCANLAIEDFKQLMQKLFDLEECQRELPKIKLKIYNTAEFDNCSLNNNIQRELYNGNVQDYKCDLLLDVSTLQTSGFTKPMDSFQEKVRAKNSLIIRSSHSIRQFHKVSVAKEIVYDINNEKKSDALRYFLKNIFRKSDFREGQLEIIKRSLARKDVIALLPTGAGKSLTYQLSALLQPGIVMVVDPLKSLMRDQNDNLHNIGIDQTAFVNASVTALQRKEICSRMKDGRYQFIFISPERLQIEEFREFLQDMKEIYFTYCVVDEAHCVSEWGHDFRTAYLRLGVNSRRFLSTYNKTPIPIIALTGTASFDVLADVERELEIKNDPEVIIAPSKYERTELEFRIVAVGQNEFLQFPDLKQAQKEIAKRKAAELNNILNLIPSEFNSNMELSEYLSISGDYPNSGLVFCPHKSGSFGVTTVMNSIVDNNKYLDDLIDYYHGDDETKKNFEEVQNKYKGNELSMLVATKAFGMGIDKPNIRFTIHFNMPQSIESFYQEAGRAGRDKMKSLCYILYSPVLCPGNSGVSVDKDLMLAFHENSFRGREKEVRILDELLTEISFPYDSQTDAISEEFSKSHEIELNFEYWAKGGKHRLYVKDMEGTGEYGYIDLQNLNIHTENTAYGINSVTLLSEVRDYLLKELPIDLSMVQWIVQKTKTPPREGIEEILAKMRTGDTRAVILGFENCRKRELADFLSKSADGWSEEIIGAAYNFANKPEKFLENLSYRYWKANGTGIKFDDNQRKFIKKYFLF